VENIEIIMSNVKKEYIDLIIYKELGLTHDKVISSHFYDEVQKKDIELSDISSLSEYYSTSRTGNIFTREVFVGDIITNVMLIMSFDKKIGDIVLNFEEDEFITHSEEELKRKVKEIFAKLVEILNRYEIEEIRIGYEPASDDDMLLSLINKEGVKIKSNLNSLIAKLIISL